MRINVSNTVTLTPAQNIQWDNFLTALSWKASAFTHLLYELLNPEQRRMVAVFLADEGLPEWFKAGVNGVRVYLKASAFFELTLEEQIFLMCHEVCHPMLGHCVAGQYYRKLGFIELGFKKMPYIDMLANIAQDYIINDMLVESRIGKFIVGGLHDTSIATYKDSWIDVYEKLYEEEQAKPKPKPKKKGKSKPCKDGEGGDDEPGESEDGEEGDPQKEGEQGRSRNNQQGFDGHMGLGEGEQKPKDEDAPEGPVEYDDGEGEVSIEEMEKQIKKAQQATAAAMELARARGNLPAALKQFCETLLEPVVPWQDHIKAQFARKLGSGGYDFRRPNRRFLVRDIIVPGRSGHGANLVIVGGDSSGSIYAVPMLTATWMAECGGIMEDVSPREVHVVWCDAEVQRVDIITDMADIYKMVHKGSEGGGGTDFRPVFQYAAELNADIDCLAFLTDGDGTFPDVAPRFPVIWGDISGNASKYPFGDVVHIPVPSKVLR